MTQPLAYSATVRGAKGGADQVRGLPGAHGRGGVHDVFHGSDHALGLAGGDGLMERGAQGFEFDQGAVARVQIHGTGA